MTEPFDVSKYKPGGIPEKTLIDYEYEDGFQTGLEVETSSELIGRVAESLGDPDVPSSWTYGLVQGWLSKKEAG